MAATTRNNPNEENAESGGSGTRANTSNNNNNNNSCNNNNNDNSKSQNKAVMDEADIKLKRQKLEQRKQELERVLSEKNWLLQQIQKQETQIVNGNYEYLNANEIFTMLARQYKKEYGGSVGSDAGSTAILRRKTISGSCKENQPNHNNNGNNNRQSEISNRSSEYDNYPGGNSSIGDSNTSGLNVGAAQQQLTKSQSLKKRSTNTPTATTVANFQYLQAQQRQQQLLQQQMLQNHMQYTALVQHQHYHHQQQQLHPHTMHEEHQQHQQIQQHPPQQQYKQQISPSHSQSRHYPADTISLYSVNSASVATLRQQHISPQQQPIVVQCDRYYLSPTHQSYNDGGFIKSSQNVKKYISPQPSPTHHGVATTQTLQHSHQTLPYPQDLLMPSGVTLEQKFQHHQQQQQQQQQSHQQQQFLTLQQLQPHILLHQPQHTTSRQLDAISLAPSYISLEVDSAAAHNQRWRSQSNLPPVSPHKGLVYNSSQIAADTKSHSSDMLSSNAYYNTSAALPAAAIKSLTKPLDEISISSLNSETQKSKPPKPKQWLESSLDGPVMRQTPTSGIVSGAHAQDIFQNAAANSSRPPTNKIHTAASTLAGAGACGPRERGKLSSQSMSGAPRHYSMSAASHKHPYSHTKLLQDDDGRYAKLSQSTSYLNSRESPSISAAYALDGSTNSTTIELPTPTSTMAFKYLPPKPGSATNAASRLTPPPPPRPPPIGEKTMVACAGVAAIPSALSPTDIRIESPKNMTVVKPATFRPYQEETKPFEMSDFYKYSTKFRQKESSASNVEH